jgi:hypothetical protein
MDTVIPESSLGQGLDVKERNGLEVNCDGEIENKNKSEEDNPIKEILS